jgi:hypothetical protein
MVFSTLEAEPMATGHVRPITWIRREFHYFGSKLPENPVFAPKYLQQSLDFSQS